MKLSVVISAFNEEQKIKDCLEAIKDIASEIIVVDNSSTDKTVDIAKKYTSKIFNRPNYRMLNINKNFGFSKARGEWILNLDADEVVTKELALEIKSIAENKSQVAGYWMPRKNIIFGKWIQYTGWYPDNQLRLFKRGFGKFPEKEIHEMIEVKGITGYLSNHLIHKNYETISQFLHKMSVINAPSEAEERLKKGYVFAWTDAIQFPFKEFLSRFFAREGYKDGFHGLMLSILMAFYHFIVFAYIWEKQGFRVVDEENLLDKIFKEFRKIYGELLFWFRKEMISNRVKRKMYYMLDKFHWPR